MVGVVDINELLLLALFPSVLLSIFQGCEFFSAALLFPHEPLGLHGCLLSLLMSEIRLGFLSFCGGEHELVANFLPFDLAFLFLTMFLDLGKLLRFLLGSGESFTLSEGLCVNALLDETLGHSELDHLSIVFEGSVLDGAEKRARGFFSFKGFFFGCFLNRGTWGREGLEDGLFFLRKIELPSSTSKECESSH